MKFFGGRGNKNGTVFSGGIDAEMEVSFSTNTEFLFYGCFAWPI
jgi:hypothetical protein